MLGGGGDRKKREWHARKMIPGGGGVVNCGFKTSGWRLLLEGRKEGRKEGRASAKVVIPNFERAREGGSDNNAAALCMGIAMQRQQGVKANSSNNRTGFSIYLFRIHKDCDSK